MKNRILFLSTILLSINSIVLAAERDTEDFKALFTALLSALSWIGFIIAFIALILMGIKYTMSPASEKANLKNRFETYMIGAILIIASSAIVAVIANTAGNNTKDDVIDSAIINSGATPVENSQKKK